MRHSKNSILLSIGIAAALDLTTGCSRLPIYSHFELIPSDGWEQDDTLRFRVPVKDAGSYDVQMHLRATSLYPYTQLMLNVGITTRHLPLTTHLLPFTIDITDDEGNRLGEGLSIRQYNLGLPSANLRKNDTLVVTVAHNMHRNPLPGINDVGITVTATP